MLNMEQIKEILVSHAVELFSKHSVKQDEMFQWIRDAITSSVSDLPKQRILYCGTYGGYSLSEEFEKFIRTKKISFHKHREMAATYVQPFGKSILDKQEFAGLREHLYEYKTSKLRGVLQHVVSLYFDKRRLASYVKNVNSLENYLLDQEASRDVVSPQCKPCESYLAYNGHVNQWGHKYARHDLEDVLKHAHEGTYRRGLEKGIANHQAAALAIVTREVFDDFTEHYKEVQKYVAKRGSERKTFIASLQEKG